MDNRDWRIFRDRKGWVRWFQRYYEACLIISGRQSLHNAWQLGLHAGSSMEYTRLIRNGAWRGELAAIEKSSLRAALPRHAERPGAFPPSAPGQLQSKG